jgi:hypothetical protein
MAIIDVFFNRVIDICVRVGSLSNASQQIQLVQGDTGPKLQFTLKDCAGNIIDSGVSGVNFYLKKYCGPCVNTGHTSVSGVNVSGGLYSYCLVSGDTVSAGTYFGDVEITYDNGKVETGFDAVRILIRKNNKCS